MLGAFYLLELDLRMERLDVKYVRYMDDILILAPTRWKLKKAIKVFNQTFNELKLEKHPDKTAMGRSEKGFDFLGYHFGPEGLSLAEKTIENFVSRLSRLYEQEQRGTFRLPSAWLVCGTVVYMGSSRAPGALGVIAASYTPVPRQVVIPRHKKSTVSR